MGDDERTGSRAVVKPLSGGASLRANRVWEPFTEGNQAATTHGAYSSKARAPRVEELVTWLLAQEALTHIRDESFRPAVFRWAERQAMADLLFRQLEAHHLEKGRDGRPCPGCKRCRGWEERWQRFDRTAERAAAAIGLDPMSRSELLTRMNSSGLLNLAEDAKSMLGNLIEGLTVTWVQEEHIRALEAALEAAGVRVPERPAELLALGQAEPAGDWVTGMPGGDA